MSEPKPCPFCKSWSVVRYSYRFSNNIHYQCSKCGCLFTFDSKSKDTWNTRPAEDAKDREIERLKGALSEIRTIGDCTEMIEDVVARGMMRKIAFDALYGNTISKLLANAPDSTKGMEK